MKVNSLEVNNVRNLCHCELEADPELTVIAGANGQGKTNLLESIWLLTGSKSFRGAKDSELVRQGEQGGSVSGCVFASGRDSRIDIRIGGSGEKRKGRWAHVNDVDYGRAGAAAGIFTAVVFDPNHLKLIKGGPDGRRRFLDAALCQVYPGYLGILRRFYRALSQKNALLRQYQYKQDADSLLDAFDLEISASGEEVTRRRREYLEKAGPAAQEFYSEISSGAEEMQIRFLPCCESGGLLDLLTRSRRADTRMGFSTSGVQREDFEVLIGGRSARIYGSQGQQRSAVLSLKLAEAAQAKRITGEHPVMLLDDVLSELDEVRQAYLLSRMDQKQSFVTTCDASAFGRAGGKVVTMENGEIR